MEKCKIAEKADGIHFIITFNRERREENEEWNKTNVGSLKYGILVEICKNIFKNHLVFM